MCTAPSPCPLPRWGRGREELAFRGQRLWPAAHPDETDDGEQDTGEARDLGHSIRAGPEAVDAQSLDEQSPHRVQPDIPEEHPSRAIMPSRPDPPHEQGEDHEVPQRFIEEGGVEALRVLELGGPTRGRGGGGPKKNRGAAGALLAVTT